MKFITSRFVRRTGHAARRRDMKKSMQHEDKIRRSGDLEGWA
jgi:hypothetical protein